jgi:hypothetical protein
LHFFSIDIIVLILLVIGSIFGQGNGKLIGHISGNFAGHVLAGQCKINF